MTEPGPDPFASAAQFQLTVKVNLLQLQDEIGSATGRSVTTALTDYDPDAEISTDNPATLWIMPADIDGTAVEQAITDHIPDPTYNIPAADRAYNAAVQKILDSPTAELTTEELHTVVKGMAVRLAGQTTATASTGVIA